MLTYDPAWIVDHIHDVKAFAKEIAIAAAHATQTGDLSRLRNCLLDWEATAEINAIPGMQENVIAGYEAIQQGTDENLPTWAEFIMQMGVAHENE